MHDHTTLRLAEELLKAFEGRLTFDTAQIRAILEGEEELVTRVLDFLVGRDELLMAAGRSPRFFHKNNLIQAIVNLLKDALPRSAEDIAEALGVPIATTCEILGWLERDRRIEARHNGGSVVFVVR